MSARRVLPLALLVSTTFALPQSLPHAGPAVILPRGESTAPLILGRALNATNLPYNTSHYIAPPRDRKVTQWIALGDSYSAGIGAGSNPERYPGSGDCDRYPGSYPAQMQADKTWGGTGDRLFNFASCTGAKMADLPLQLASGGPVEGAKHPGFGQPQLAVVSISGNDVDFGKIVRLCIFGLPPWGCESSLREAEMNLRNINGYFQKRIYNSLIQIVSAGRQAGGATPPQSFQLFVTGYVEFFDEDSDACNTIKWPLWGGLLGEYLNRDLRRRLNRNVRELNNIIKLAVKDANATYQGGVYYVDGWQADYDNHRFCKPGMNLEKPIKRDTWFYHPASPLIEPPEGFDVNTIPTVFDEILASLVPTLKNGSTPDQQIAAVDGDASLLNPVFGDLDDLIALLERNAEEIGPASAIFRGLSLAIRRVFHPKDFAYASQARAVIKAINAASQEGT